MTSRIAGIDHVAITVTDIDRATDFYRDVLGAVQTSEYAPGGRVLVRSLTIGGCALNIHQQGNGIRLVARRPTPGSADVCFRWAGTIEQAEAHLARKGVEVIDGPAPRFSADGKPGRSVYFTDPDGNLLELMSVTSAEGTVAPS